LIWKKKTKRPACIINLGNYITYFELSALVFIFVCVFFKCGLNCWTGLIWTLCSEVLWLCKLKQDVNFSSQIFDSYFPLYVIMNNWLNFNCSMMPSVIEFLFQSVILIIYFQVLYTIGRDNCNRTGGRLILIL
jgi:hypothetical protein